MRYTPSAVTASTAGLRGWIAEELRRIAAALNEPDSIQLARLAAEPAKPKNGMLVYADGVAWNPGAGAGFYGYQSGAWVKL